MTYAEMLSAVIDESSLSLRQITNRCQALNLNITPSYISQLKNGKLPPPSEEVSLTLAKACGAKNQAQLVFQGYLEKAPSIVREYMAASSGINKALLESLAKMSGEEDSAAAGEFLKSIDVLAAMEISSRFLDPENAGNLKTLVNDIKEACGNPGKADTKGEQSHFFVSDEAMAPAVPLHSYATLMPTKTELLKDRDIIALYPDNRRTPILRRLYFIKGKLLLAPDNKDFETFFFDSFDEFVYVGKVISYKVDL